MTSSLKIVAFFVLAVTSSCYGQSTTVPSTTVPSELCPNTTVCNDCFNVTGCVFRLKDCSNSNSNSSKEAEAVYICVHNTTVNVTAVEKDNNCSAILDTDGCASASGPNGSLSTTPSPGIVTTDNTTVSNTPTSPDPPQAVVAVDNPNTTASVIESTPSTGEVINTGTTPIPTEEHETTTESAQTASAESTSTGPTTTSAPTSGAGNGTNDTSTAVPTSPTPEDVSSTTPEEHTSSTGHPSTSDHTDPAGGKPSTSRHFDAPSFIGGIILSVGLLAIAFVGYKFYRARTEHNYHTL